MLQKTSKLHIARKPVNRFGLGHSQIKFSSPPCMTPIHIYPHPAASSISHEQSTCIVVTFPGSHSFSMHTFHAVWSHRSTPAVWSYRSTPAVWSYQSTPAVWSYQSTPAVWSYRSTPVVWSYRSTPVVWSYRSTPVVWSYQSTMGKVPVTRYPGSGFILTAFHLTSFNAQ